MKMRDVISSEKCQKKSLYNDFSGEKKKNYYNGVVIRELFKTFGINYNNKVLMQLIKDTMPQELFQTNREGTINTTLLVLRLLRFQEYFSKRIPANATVHNGGVTFVTSHNIEVDYSLIIEDDSTVNIIKVKNSKCSLSKGGHSVHTKIAQNMEMYLLQLAAESLFPGKVCESTLVFLRHPDDKNDTLVPASRYADSGKTIIGTSFVGSNKLEMEKRLEDTINGVSKHQCSDCANCEAQLLCTHQKDNTNLLAIPTKSKASGKVSFTKAQEEVIQARAGIYRVLAGAGSGKTTCIANRICELVKNGCNPHNILLITYTTKGVDEMREKIEYWLRKKKIKANIDDFQIFTFNSFGFELVKKEYAAFGYTEEPGLLEKSEKMTLIKALLDAEPEIEGFNYKEPMLNMPYAKGVVLQMDEYFDKLKIANAMYPEEVQLVLGIKKLDVATEVLKLYKKFRKHMKDNNLVDYADQVNLCYEILKDTAKLKLYGFEHVIVDEFQDSDNLQINILTLLSSFDYFLSLMVVGDDSQAIYSWRGATSNNIINFKDVFPNAIDINLLENFRSTVEICELANKINDINKDKVPKNLIGQKNGNKPKLFCLNGVENFVNKMLEIISYYGMEFSDIAFIARNKKELLQMQDILVSKNVPCIIAVNELLIENAVVKHLIDFAKFLVDNNASLYFAEFLQVYDPVKFDSQTNATLKTYVTGEMNAFLDELSSCKNDAERVQNVLAKFEKIAQTDRAVKSLLSVLSSRRFANLSQLAEFLINMELYKADYTIEKLDTPVNAITLTTAHSSKGREWDTVCIYLDSFSYPSNYYYQQDKNNPTYEEERRLLFVAITRAKEHLFMTGNTTSSCYMEVARALNIR